MLIEFKMVLIIELVVVDLYKCISCVEDGMV